jgi:hypothetical protein
MAQIDPNIALGFRMPQFQDPVAATARAQEVGVNALKMNEMQRSLESQNKLRELYSQGVDVSTPEGFKQLAAVDPSAAMKLRTEALQGQKLQGDIKKTGVETKLKELDVQREQFGNLVFNPSDANITAHIEDSVLQGKIPPAQAQSLLAQVLPLDTARRKQFFTDMGLKVEQRAQMDTTRRGQDISAATTRRGQDLQYAPDVVANTVTDAAGNVTQFNRFGEVIGKPGAVGKPSATFEKTKAMQKQMGRDLDLAITEIENAIKKGGTLDKSTASGAGRLLDAAGNFIGYATEGSIASAALKPIADLGLKMVPRFEGPQSDKDTASYKEASGQLANESLPVATRRAAAETVVRLMKARKGQFVTEGMAAEGIGAGAPALPPGFTPDKP